MKFILVLVAVFGMSLAAPRDLQSDLHEFVELIPIDNIRALAREYLKTDAEFQSVLAYLQGPEWAQLVSTVGSKASFQKFLAYMLEAGIDLQAIIDMIHDIIAGATPGRSFVAPRSLRDFLDEVSAMIPKDELLVLLNIKLNNSAAFQEFWGKVTSEESHQLVEEVRAIDEVQLIAAKLTAMGVKVKEALEIIYKLFGWK